MSAFGTKRTLEWRQLMSVIAGKTEVVAARHNVGL
jgi:hypothetical protein